MFTALLNGKAKATEVWQQFNNIINLVRDAYAEDLSTILALLSIVEEQTPLLETKLNRSIFGEKVVELTRRALLQTTDSLTPKYYEEFKTDLDKVQGNFANFVVNGNEAFKVLLRDINRLYTSRKRNLLI